MLPRTETVPAPPDWESRLAPTASSALFPIATAEALAEDADGKSLSFVPRSVPTPGSPEESPATVETTAADDSFPSDFPVLAHEDRKGRSLAPCCRITSAARFPESNLFHNSSWRTFYLRWIYVHRRVAKKLETQEFFRIAALEINKGIRGDQTIADAGASGG